MQKKKSKTEIKMMVKNNAVTNLFIHERQRLRIYRIFVGSNSFYRVQIWYLLSRNPDYQ